MKILFLLKSHKYSGAESVILTIMKLLPAKYKTYYASPDGPIRNAVEDRGQNFIALDKPDLKSVKKVIYDVKPDIIHASDFSMSVLAAMASSKIPIVSHLHANPTWIKEKFDLRSIAYKLALRRINKVICVSPSIINEFGSKYLKQKAIIIPNIVDINKIRKLANDDSGIDSDICFVGRLTSAKNPLLFCEIIKEIRRRDHSVRAVMVGQGDLKTQIENYIQKNNLSNNIKLVGFRKNPYPYMKKTRVCIMPSKYEGFGLSAVEMLSFGKPVIASNVGGLKSIINEDCGTLISGFNAKEYANVYFALIRPNEYRKKSNGALLTSQNFADTDLFKKRFIRIYMEAAQCRN